MGQKIEDVLWLRRAGTMEPRRGILDDVGVVVEHNAINPGCHMVLVGIKHTTQIKGSLLLFNLDS
jgi:hypothetical protein